MGATNNIRETNLSLKIAGLTCSQCLQPFTQQEINNRNFDCWFDTSNEVSLIPMEELAKKRALASLSTEYFERLYFPFKHEGYQFTIWIRTIDHRYCPDSSLFELCEECDERFLKEKMKEHQGDYYCQPCYQQIKKETN